MLNSLMQNTLINWYHKTNFYDLIKKVAILNERVVSQ